jgi:hypothetical protein
MSMPSVFLVYHHPVTVTETSKNLLMHLQLPTLRHRQFKNNHICRRIPNPFTVAMVTSPNDKILLSRHRRVTLILLHLINSSLLKDLSIPLEYHLHLNNFLELPRVPWTILVLYLIQIMADLNMAHPSLVDNLWEAPW